MNTPSPTSDLPRLVLAAIFMLLFGYAIFVHYDQGLEQVLMNVILLLVGYWFGSSKGSTDKSAQLADAVATGASGKPSDPVNVEIKP